MQKVLLYSALLICGLVASQFLQATGAIVIKVMTMFALSFIMIHVGYEFEIDKSRPRQYAWDYVVAATAAAFPWIFCTLYFVFVMAPPQLWSHIDLWKESLLEGRFASPTSAGVLFSMLAAAGLGGTWVFKKARILAIFDDLDTILLMIPLTMLIIGFRWQLMAVVAVMVALLWLAWRYLHVVRLPVTWPFVTCYAGIVTALSEAIYLGSKVIDQDAPVHLEVLLPAFVVGCLLAYPGTAAGTRVWSTNGEGHKVEGKGEETVGTIVAACFMVLVGLSMPPIVTATKMDSARSDVRYQGVAEDLVAEKQTFPGWPMVAVHVLVITGLSNLGKMFPAACYRREATARERTAVAVCMFPRGEVGAGVLVISLSYGLAGPAITVALLSLALNLLCTGPFIAVVKRLIRQRER